MAQIHLWSLCNSRKLLKCVAGTTGLEPATSAVTDGQPPANLRGIKHLRVQFTWQNDPDSFLDLTF